jgi:multidrug efflux pump subunit AcrA (membrane-fusion protein)
MQKSIIIIVIVVFVAATAIALAKIFLFGHQVTQIAIVTVTRGDITAKITAVGSILPLKTTRVKSPVSGTVAKLFRDEGDYVKQGEALLKVNPKPTPSDYATKKHTVAMDLVKEHKAALDVKRYEYLLQQGMIAKNDQNYDLAKRDYQLAHKQLAPSSRLRRTLTCPGIAL